MKLLFPILLLLSNFLLSQTNSSYKVRLLNEKEELFDTIITLEYFNDKLYLFDSFLYPQFERSLKNNNCLLFTHQNMSLEICSSPFIPSNNELKFAKDSFPLIEINGKSFWGTDGGIPTKQISKIVFNKGKSSINVPTNYFDDLYQPNLGCFNSKDGQYCFVKVYLIENQEIILTMLNSDGAGGYIVIMIFDINGNVKDRRVGYGF